MLSISIAVVAISSTSSNPVYLCVACLQDTYGGFLDYQLSDDFAYYADIAFEHLGPYIKHWLTFNEPMSICQLGYGVGIYAPGVERGAYGHYRCGHTLLLAHAKAVQLYRLKYQQAQGGRMSMVLSAHWGLPKNPKSKEGRSCQCLSQKSDLSCACRLTSSPIFHTCTCGLST